MDTADTVEKVAVKKGRPAKKDKATPQGEYQIEQAKKARSRKSANAVVDKWYELRGQKLSLCKELNTGTVFRTYVGSLNDPKAGKEVRTFVDKLEAEGRLKHRV
jgi:hypothetical protein